MYQQPLVALVIGFKKLFLEKTAPNVIHLKKKKKDKKMHKITRRAKKYILPQNAKNFSILTLILLLFIINLLIYINIHDNLEQLFIIQRSYRNSALLTCF